ncbi:MAG: hypothetical protein WBE13_04855 [Candidatus Acidiferrum sp.]
MKRRKFLQLLGIAPVAVVAAKFLPAKKPLMTSHPYPSEPKIIPDHHFEPVTETVKDWQPNTCYNVGDKIVVNGDIYTVRWTGISGSCRPLVNEEFMDKMPRLNPWGTVALKKA